MSPNHPPNRRQLTASGDAIRSLRQGLGWTQAELARRSGYSVRLIQKAESGGALAPGTLDVLAKTLSQSDQVVTIEDLTATPESVAKAFVDAINEHYGEVVSRARHLFHDDIVINCAGDPEELPFAGIHRGIEAADNFYRLFASMLTPSPGGFFQNFRYLSKGNEVIGWGEAFAKVDGMPGPRPLVWVWIRLEVQDGQVLHWENQFDTRTASSHVAEARARELLDKPSDDERPHD